MLAAIHQPQYFPWLGYLDKIDKAGVFIILDDVQFEKSDLQNRNKIKSSQGWQWLTVPFIHNFPQKINEVQIDNSKKWRKKHINALKSCYSKSDFFEVHNGEIVDIIDCKWERLLDLDLAVTNYLLKALGITAKIKLSSDFKTRNEPTNRLVDLCKSLGCNEYFSGRGAKKYLDPKSFEAEDIKLTFQEFAHPQYKQLHGEFSADMSAIDLLFNCGDQSLDILRGL